MGIIQGTLSLIAHLYQNNLIGTNNSLGSIGGSRAWGVRSPLPARYVTSIYITIARKPKQGQHGTDPNPQVRQAGRAAREAVHALELRRVRYELQIHTAVDSPHEQRDAKDDGAEQHAHWSR